MTTITISNFGGRLTRILNGDLNSGFAKYNTSFGYDPFSKPMNLTWLETPTDITGTAITDLVLASVSRVENGNMFVYALGSTGKLYKIQPNSSSSATVDSVVGIGSVAAGGPTFNKGASMQLFGFSSVVGGGSTGSVLGRIFIGSDGQINKINVDFGGDAVVGSGPNYVQNRYRPLAQFIGKLIFGNGNTIGVVDSTGTVTSPLNVSSVYSQLNPGFPPETYVTDIDVNPNGTYVAISSSGIQTEGPLNFVDTTGSLNPSETSAGNVFYWNGTDQAATASQFTGAVGINALQNYLNRNMIFSGDAFGTSVGTEFEKEISVQNTKPPFPNATAVNGNFLTWVAPEVVSNGTGMVGSLYYFGKLDQETPNGLYRLCRVTNTMISGFMIQAPYNTLVNRKYQYVNTTSSSIISLGLGKHYLSFFERNSGNNKFTLQRFLVTPTGSGTPQFGVYETQTQLFSNRIGIAQVRVYTEPMVAGNAFQLDLIGADGSPISNGTFTYAFGDVRDPQSNSTAVERINFNPNTKTQFSLGIRVTNTGTTNFCIKKIEIDLEEQGK